MSKKVILSLFDYSGNWPKYYREDPDQRYEVIQIDIKHGRNVLDLTYTDLPARIYGILAAPPCTDFAASGAQYWNKKDSTGQTAQSLKLVDKTLDLIDHFKPVWWALEQPVGRLNKLRPQLGAPWYFQPWWYGDPYTKQTALYGNFNRTLPEKIVRPHPRNPIYYGLGGNTEYTKTARSMTPLGFARAFYLANP